MEMLEDYEALDKLNVPHYKSPIERYAEKNNMSIEDAWREVCDNTVSAKIKIEKTNEKI